MNNQILFEEINHDHDKTGLITLNRPEVLNAINNSMFHALHSQLHTWQHDPDIKAVVIEGSGNRAFCAGGDIRSLYHNKAPAPEASSDQPFFTEEYQLNETIYHYPKPYIALLNGITMGGGAGLSIPGRWRIATERFIFAMPETKIGFFPDVGMGYFLTQLPCHLGFYLGLTGESLTAADALEFELIDSVISSENLIAFREKLLKQKVITDGAIYDLTNEYHITLPSPELSLINKVALIDQHFSLPTVEEIIESLQTGDTWCQQTAQTLLLRSPTSLKVTLKHLYHCKNYSFREVIIENTILANHFLVHGDLFEGIRAMIIDKDLKPQWHPKRLNEVTVDRVNSFFGS